MYSNKNYISLKKKQKEEKKEINLLINKTNYTVTSNSKTSTGILPKIMEIFG